jgi:hypothetical protein
MDKKELNIILKEGEGYKIEFKEGISGIEKVLPFLRWSLMKITFM